MHHNFKEKYIIVPSKNPVKPTAFSFKCISSFNDKNRDIIFKKFY